MNPGGIRTDLDAGDITYGEAFAVQPFGNSLVTLTLTGAQIDRVLEQQWDGQGTTPKVLQDLRRAHLHVERVRPAGQPRGSRRRSRSTAPRSTPPRTTA